MQIVLKWNYISSKLRNLSQDIWVQIFYCCEQSLKLILFFFNLPYSFNSSFLMFYSDHVSLTTLQTFNYQILLNIRFPT